MEDSKSLLKCPRCEDRREVEATSGQPEDGPMPCPDCVEREVSERLPFWMKVMGAAW